MEITSGRGRMRIPRPMVNNKGVKNSKICVLYPFICKMKLYFLKGEKNIMEKKNKFENSLKEEERKEKVRKISQMLMEKNKQAYSNLAKR